MLSDWLMLDILYMSFCTTLNRDLRRDLVGAAVPNNIFSLLNVSWSDTC